MIVTERAALLSPSKHSHSPYNVIVDQDEVSAQQASMVDVNLGMEGQVVPPQITFDVEDHTIPSDAEHWGIWKQAKPWLSSLGYTLYEDSSAVHVNYRRYPYLDPDALTSKRHPYGVSPQGCELKARCDGRVMFAQDKIGRHVVFKLSKTSCVEYKVYKMFADDPSLFEVDNFPGVLPVLDFIPWGSQHCLIVLPRWGSSSLYPLPESISGILDFIRYTLRGLRYVHNRGVVHRDVAVHNTLVNFFSDDTWPGRFSRQHIEFGRVSQVLYTIFDFDVAVIFPQDAPTHERRLPWYKSLEGTWHRPYDTAHGELDYDPFAWDVGSLGILFCERFQHLTPAVPFLAPLFDKMTARDVNRRFTAAQALSFFEEHVTTVPHKVLTGDPTPGEISSLAWDEYDHWAGLPPMAVAHWQHLREPPLPRLTAFLRHICGAYPWAELIIREIRRCCSLTFIRVTTLEMDV